MGKVNRNYQFTYWVYIYANNFQDVIKVIFSEKYKIKLWTVQKLVSDLFTATKVILCMSDFCTAEHNL